jgi:hypothetical protein
MKQQKSPKLRAGAFGGLLAPGDPETSDFVFGTLNCRIALRLSLLNKCGTIKTKFDRTTLWRGDDDETKECSVGWH